jgi:hypothetical protein
MHFGGIFCGLAKAFHCVDREIFLSILHFYGIQGTDSNYFRSYLTDIRKRNKII